MVSSRVGTDTAPLYSEEVSPPRWFVGLRVGVVVVLLVPIVSRYSVPLSLPPGALVAVLLAAAGGWLYWTQRVIGTRSILIQRGSMILLKGPLDFLSYANTNYPALASGDSGPLATGIVLGRSSLVRADRLPLIGHLLPPVRDWWPFRKTFHVSMVRTGVEIRTDRGRRHRFWVSTRHPDQVIDASRLAGARIGASTPD
ncbi:MAG: hypothetical protein O3A10_14585 [Chloroflexi bacterium]|nr:hypothetical protein [Chloroflexota bacterium]MDA1147592.1 hypothetical protein [Chloroflexota bacterium]